MEKSKISYQFLFPVLLSFFVMSFCDLVGIGVDRVKTDYPDISNTLIQLIPSAVFLWFFILSVPVGILQDRIGKRNVLNLGMLVTALGLFVPYFFYSFSTALIGFALLGIGNTIVQVSANPLLVDVVPSNRRSSFLSFSQFIKAIGSMVAAPFAGFLAGQFGDWKLIFLVFGIVSLLSVIWLYFSKIEETVNTEKRATFGSSFKLFGNGYITAMVIGIFLVVGIDVGINAISGQFLLAKFNCEQTFAESGRSVYFFGKMLGTFGGALLLAKVSSRKFFFWSSIVGLVSIIGLFFAPTPISSMVIIFIIGLGVANIFPLIFSITVGKYPTRANEISGLMIMAVSGGAAIPPLMGWIQDSTGKATATIFVLVACAVYLLGLSLFQKKEEKE
ncbi:MAG TPA: MFS transporter [Bacteroidales bacterium]|jgi:fucose permease|nr:MFS transporter [Bacteroidales bacterium]HPS72208.1 MFS transporter [Bacteroidales bacterium]